MQIFTNTKVDFMGKKWVWIGLSAVLVLHGIVQLTTQGINKGVEFAGGAQVILKYQQPVDVNQVRQQLEAAQLKGVSVTSFGDAGDNEISIRVALPEDGANIQGDLAQRVVGALRPDELEQKSAAGMFDLNEVDQVQLAERLVAEAGVEAELARASATAISEYRKQNKGLFSSVEQASTLPGVADAAKSFIARAGFVGPFALRGQDVIEGTVSVEMRTKAYGAMLGALIGMLIYIWIRFQFLWGLAAIFALAHDVIVTLGLFILFGYEADLPVVAAFLTLVGFSVNDTIVTFDRLREIIRARGGEDNLTNSITPAIVNSAINQTLSRTIITATTVFLTAICLFFFGGPVLNPFAFVLTVGILVGTYSSIYIASPMLVIWRDWLASRAASRSVSSKAARA
jgi:preprotein translocase subunit SecF